MRINVVGGGIMGLSTALALVESGHKVTLFEQGPIPNPKASSVDDHRLIRHPYGPMTGYARLIGPAFSAWDHTWSALGQRLYQPTGTLILARDDTTWAETSLEEMAAQGIETERLDSDTLRARAPMLHAEDATVAAWVDSGGVLLADQIVAAVGAHLLMRGVAMRTNTPVVDIDPVRGSLVTGDGERLRSDAIVVAAGPWVRTLCPNMRVKPSRQVVIHLDTPPAHHDAWTQAPMVLDIHEHGGIYVVPPVAGTPLKVGDHSFSLKGHPDIDSPPTETETAALFEACRTRFADMDSYTLSGAKTCFYTVAAEERFVLKRTDKMVVMSGFSGHGFKFGALMGRLAAQVATGGDEDGALRALAAGEITEADEIAQITRPCLA
jgi:glycine/D-amino acid oxidase-like deaminating enzyme